LSQKLELAAQPLPVVISQPSPLELAQQGNVEALVALNRSLQPKGITCQSCLEGWFSNPAGICCCQPERASGIDP